MGGRWYHYHERSKRDKEGTRVRLPRQRKDYITAIMTDRTVSLLVRYEKTKGSDVSGCCGHTTGACPSSCI